MLTGDGTHGQRHSNAKRRKAILRNNTNDFGTGDGRDTPVVNNTAGDEATTNALWAAANGARNEGSNSTGGDDIQLGQIFLSQIKDTAAEAAQKDQSNDAVAFTARVRDVPLKLSKELPHAEIPIGTEGGSKHKLLVAVDSCAGTNFGELEYHQTMAELYPELVHTFRAIAENDEPNIIIGGANQNDSLVVTHIIIYITPMSRAGCPCYLSFGLSKDAVATAILSITFLRNAKALWSFDDVVPSVYFHAWNESVDVKYIKPSRRVPPQQRQYQEAEEPSNIFLATRSGLEEW